MISLIEFFENYQKAINEVEKSQLHSSFLESIPESLRDSYDTYLRQRKKGLKITRISSMKWAEEKFNIPGWLYEICLESAKDWRSVFANLCPHPEIPWEESLTQKDLIELLSNLDKKTEFVLEIWPEMSIRARRFLLALEKRTWIVTENLEMPLLTKVQMPTKDARGVLSSEPMTQNFELLYLIRTATAEQFAFGVAEGFPVLIVEKAIPSELRKELKEYSQQNQIQKFGPNVSVKKGLIARISFSQMKKNLRKKSGLEILDPKLEEILVTGESKAVPLEELKKLGQWT